MIAYDGRSYLLPNIDVPGIFITNYQGLIDVSIYSGDQFIAIARGINENI